jgi:hypothetical protein
MPYCPTCNKDYETGKRFCRHCGTELVERLDNKPPEVRLAAWTQGMSRDGRADGSFDGRDLPDLSLEEALRILEDLPIPPADEDPADYCWPTLGFPDSAESISRMDNGDYFSFPDERSRSLKKARRWLNEVYSTAAK